MECTFLCERHATIRSVWRHFLPWFSLKRDEVRMDGWMADCRSGWKYGRGKEEEDEKWINKTPLFLFPISVPPSPFSAPVVCPVSNSCVRTQPVNQWGAQGVSVSVRPWGLEHTCQLRANYYSGEMYALKSWKYRQYMNLPCASISMRS